MFITDGIKYVKNGKKKNLPFSSESGKSEPENFQLNKSDDCGKKEVLQNEKENNSREKNLRIIKLNGKFNTINKC